VKISYKNIQFEVTRRCNDRCKHCCRGKCQNIDLTKEIVDAFFDNNDIIYIGTISFSGGEPSLNAEIVEYIVDKLIEMKIEYSHFIISTNGLVYSEKLIKALDKLNEYRKVFRCTSNGVYGNFFISDDQFHSKPCVKTIESYSKYKFFNPYRGDRNIDLDNLLPYGYAVENGLTNKQQDLSKITDYKSCCNIINYEGEKYLVFNYQYICSNGNVSIDGGMTYDLMDMYAIGNVTKSTIVDLFLPFLEKA